MKVAFIHDWLNGMRGGEKCLEALLELFPDAQVFTLLHEKDKLSSIISQRHIHSTWIEKLPFWRMKYRYYLPLFPLAIKSFDLRGFDLVVSISHCVAKGVKVPSGVRHVCYCLTPMRYIWEFQDVYFGSGKFKYLRKLGMNAVLRWLKHWDLKTVPHVREYVAISEFVKKRIERYYGREADVIYPPVDTEMFYYTQGDKKGDYDLVVSALVPYKRVDLVIDVYNQNGRRLKIVGAGTEYEKLREGSAENIEFLGWMEDRQMRQLYARARVLLFPGIEDFGIVPLEAQACGTPVIAYRSGGALETVIDHKTGLFFDRQEAINLKEVVEKFESFDYDREILRDNALRFSRDKYKKRMYHYLMNDDIGKNPVIQNA